MLILKGSHAHSVAASGIRTVPTHPRFGVSAIKAVSRTLAINLRVADTVGPSLRPNFRRLFRAIPE